jgi:geranylgeranyl diphosphate synthase, type II
MDVTQFLKEKSTRVERALDAYLATWTNVPERLVEAVRYSLFAGGKRLRPALALGASELVCGDESPAMPAACAIEMIHTYSLIHDDLPAMDNDDLRRGKPTSHVKFGEAAAILAGDTLLTMAFDVLAQSGNAAVTGEVARAAGAAGMAGGQFLDMEAEGKQIDLEALRAIHRAKTGALIRVSARAGAMLAGADATCLDALTRYAEHIGLAFQIADDILDVVGDEAALGKPIGSDVANAKATYPALLGLDRSRELAKAAVESAVASLASFGPEADIFRALATFIVERNS